MSEVIRLRDRVPFRPGALRGEEERGESATVIILPVVRVERYDDPFLDDDPPPRRKRRRPF